MAGIADLTKAIAKEVNVKSAVVEEVIKATFETIKAVVVNDETVRIGEFGTFSMKTKAARKGRNPRTGESVDIPAKNVLAFKPVKDIFPAPSKKSKKSK